MVRTIGYRIIRGVEPAYNAIVARLIQLEMRRDFDERRTEGHLRKLAWDIMADSAGYRVERRRGVPPEIEDEIWCIRPQPVARRLISAFEYDQDAPVTPEISDRMSIKRKWYIDLTCDETL